MGTPVFLGIDAGTTRIKAALLDSGGTILAQAGRDATVYKPREGWCEMDMELLWQRLCEITTQLKAEALDVWQDIAGVGITAQGDGLWMIDEQGEPVGNAILWNDTRTRDFELNHRKELDEYLIEHHATPIFAGSMPLLLAWVKENQPDRYARAACAFHCKDWLNYNLTGVMATDYSDGSNSSVDIFSKTLLAESFQLMGIPEAARLHPPMYPSVQILGGVTPQAAALTGLKEGTPVIAGAIDVTAVSLGAGVTGIGDGCTILGTTLCNEMLIDRRQVDHRDTHGSVLCGIMPDSYLRVMAAQSGTSTIDWCRKILAPNLSFAEIEAGIEQIKPGADGIVYHPYLYGERAPFKDPNACGGFYGLTVRHDRFHLLRAVYEGLIFSLRDCYAHLPAGDGALYVSGGGTRSNLLCQLMADVLQKEVVRPGAEELGIYGVVSAVKVGLGITDDYTPVIPGGSDRFIPRIDVHRNLEEPYESFLALRRDVSDFWKSRARWQ